LKHLAVSPLAYRWHIENPSPRSAALTLGSAIHCLLLEPGKFDSRYAVFEGTRRGKAWDEWQAEHIGIESLKPDEMARARSTVAAVRAHRVASKLIDGCRAEEVTTWTDPETGLACKGRMDAIAPTHLLDLKTTRDPSPKKFERDTAEYLYHGALAWYADGAALAGKMPHGAPVYIVAAQSDEPFDVACYQLADETLEIGRGLYRSLLRRLVQCIEADYWPGVAPDLEPLFLPKWAIDRDPGAINEETF
jgi:exodeoxyribonuclease VIII